MADLNVKVTVEGGEKTKKKLQQARSILNNFNNELYGAGKLMTEYYAGLGFASQGSAFGSPWQGLSPRYAAQKAKKYPGRPILEASGNMRAGFTFTNSATLLTITNEVEYFKYHQSSKPRRKMPRRVMLEINNTLHKQVIEHFASSIKARFAKL